MHVRSVASALATMLHLPLHSPPQIEVTIRAGPTFRNDLYAPLIQNKGRIRSLSIVGQRSDIDEFISRMSAHTWPELQVLSVSHTNTAPVVSPPSYERHILRIPNIRELTHFRPKLAMGCRHTTLTTLITSFASRHNCEEVLLQCTVLESLFITHVDEDMRPVPFPDVTEVGSLRTLKLSRCAAVARTTLDSLSFPGLDTLSLVEAPPSTSHPGCGIPTMSGAPAIISRLLERSKCRLRAIIVEVAGISRPVLSEILIAANTVTSVSLGTILPYKQEMDPIVETFTPQQDKVVLPRLRKIELTIDQFPMLAPVYGIVRSRKDAGYMPLDELRMNIQGVDRHALRRWERGRLDVKKHLQLAVRWAEAGVIKKISVVTLVDGVDLVQQLMDDSLSIPTNPRRCCSA
ncbi:hypothetical protein CYLTODRAFT_423379 [Cylindrobasidium torrendii FP15055 ss-10]|uniref:Uncharacterized protein n=1 Tax=Cylindrobasidium torrendii FP15055 ss-10 TaxID=1314674 RepID=A0A0D7BAC2_9AGAR|nr:hypothetical protein CYLTODRAFT_423379 [Cylindrobasidium torrendii FP15055 ss-10]